MTLTDIDPGSLSYNLSAPESGYGYKLFAVAGGRWGEIVDHRSEFFVIAESAERAIEMFWDDYGSDDSSVDRSTIGDELQLYSVRVVSWHPRIPTEWAVAINTATAATATATQGQEGEP